MRLTKILLPTSMVIVMISAIPIPMEPNPADISDLPAADSDATLPQTVPQTVPPTIEKLSKLDRLKAKQKAQKLAKQNPADISDLPVHQSADSDATPPQTVPQKVEKLSKLDKPKANKKALRLAKLNPKSPATTPPATFKFEPSTSGDKPETSVVLDLDTMREATTKTHADRKLIMSVHGDNDKPEHWFNIILDLLRTRQKLKTYRFAMIEVTTAEFGKGSTYNVHAAGRAQFTGSKVLPPQWIALKSRD